jgi:hypothetical protein
MASAWVLTAILSLGTCWIAYLAFRAKIWRLGFVFTAGVLCFFATALPAAFYQFSHNPSLKWVAAACLTGAGVLMAFGWALNNRGSLRSLAGLMSLVLAALLILPLRLILPPSHGILAYVLSAISWILILAALNYKRFLRRADSSTE